MTIFMNKTDLQKLNMLKHIFILPRNCTLTELATDLAVSTRTVNRYLTELQEDCRLLFSVEEFNLSKSDGLIHYQVAADLGEHHILDHLHVTYTQASTEFQLMHMLLMKNYTTVNALADEFFLSPSSLYRLLYKLEAVIEKFDMTFSFADQHAGINLNYEEKNLRMFSYYFYWSTLKGLKPDISNLGSQTIDRLDDQLDWQEFNDWLPSKKEQLRYAWTTTDLRQTYKRDTIKMPVEVGKIMMIFAEIHDLSLIYKPFLSLPTDDPERLFINFFLRVTSAKLDSSEQIMEIVTKLRQLDSFYTQRTHNLVQSLHETFNLNLTESQMAYFYYEYILTLLFIFYGKVELPQDFKEIDNLSIFNQTKGDYTDSLLHQAQKYYDQSDLPTYIPANHKQTLLGFICLMLDTKKSPPLQLAIHYSRNIMGEYLIQQNLSLLFSDQSIQFTNKLDDADIIIADCYVPLQKNKQYFYIDSLTDKRRWDSLFKFVKQAITINFFKPH